MNRKTIRSLAALAIAGALTTAAQAADVAYEAVLIDGLPNTGSAGGFSWFIDDGAGVDFWRFIADAGWTVQLRVDRLNANFDPGLSLYAGQTSADTALFNSAGDWGGLSYIDYLDDEAPAFMTPGPNGDPLGSFAIPASGWYTVAVGGSGSTDAGSYPYRITMTVTAVPEPATALLWGAGIAALGWRRLRRR